MKIIEYDLTKMHPLVRGRLLDWIKIEPDGKTLKIPIDLKEATDNFIWSRYFEICWGMTKIK